MSALIQPIALLLIILAGYLFKRAGLFKDRDYRIIQTIIFNLVLPGAIVYSFATNPHDSSMLLISLFGLIIAFIPPVVVFLASRHRPVQDRAFMMLNGSGFNVGCFCFPVVQAFLGTGAIVPAAMFDIGNCVMVAAGTNVMTQTLLHIKPGTPLTAVSGPCAHSPVCEAERQGCQASCPQGFGPQCVQGFLWFGSVRHVLDDDYSHAR